MTQEKGKGENLIAYPETFVVIDTETTGLDPVRNELIEVAAIRFANGIETGRFSELVRPTAYQVLPAGDGRAPYGSVMFEGQRVRFVDSFISRLTGITNSMLIHARPIDQVLPDYLAFIGQSIVVGHNVSFDIGFIGNSLRRLNGGEFCNNYIDTMRISRKVLPELSHHRLMDLAYYYDIDYSKAHRAVEDCAITQQCLAGMVADLTAEYGSFAAGKEALWGTGAVRR